MCLEQLQIKKYGEIIKKIKFGKPELYQLLVHIPSLSSFPFPHVTVFCPMQQCWFLPKIVIPFSVVIQPLHAHSFLLLFLLISSSLKSFFFFFFIFQKFGLAQTLLHSAFNKATCKLLFSYCTLNGFLLFLSWISFQIYMKICQVSILF